MGTHTICGNFSNSSIEELMGLHEKITNVTKHTNKIIIEGISPEEFETIFNKIMNKKVK